MKKLDKKYINTYNIERDLQFNKIDSEKHKYGLAVGICFKGPNPQSYFYGTFLLILWRKSLAQSFVSFWEYFTKVLKLPSLEFSVSDFILENIQNISLVFFAFFASFM